MSTHILITGASRGIGSAAVSALAADDVKILALSSGDGDLSDSDAPTKIWADSLQKLDGRIDILINNAGIFESNPLSTEQEQWLTCWNRTMQVNLTSAAILCRQAILHWQKRASGGRIINIASRSAHRGDSPDHCHYAASKAGLVALTKSIARAYAKEDIYAFVLCPGFTMTENEDDYLKSRGGERILADIPLGRVALPEEVGEMIRWCATSAPPSMTGAVLDVNGASYVR